MARFGWGGLGYTGQAFVLSPRHGQCRAEPGVTPRSFKARLLAALAIAPQSSCRASPVQPGQRRRSGSLAMSNDRDHVC